MRKKLLSMLVLLMTAATGAWAETTIVTWTSSGSYENNTSRGGVTLSGEVVEYIWDELSGGEWRLAYDSEQGTFTTSLGNFTSIVISGGYIDGFSGTGWNGRTWTGNASSVPFRGYLTDANGEEPWTITFTIASAEPVASWVGNSAINANGTWYYAGENFGWCTGGAFNGADLGTITTLSLGGQSQAWADGNANWNDGNLTMTMGYKIDGGADESLSLNWFEFADNNNKFQSGGSSWAAQDIDISGLTPGNHTIAVWFTRDDKWDSNNSANYVANFTIPTPATTTYTVSVKEGTADAEKWTADPNPAEAGQTVTVTYSGLKKVKSVKAVKKAPAVPSYDNTLNINTYDPELNNWEDVTVPTGKHWLITGTGEATTNTIIIANNATVTLSGVNITAWGRSITCEGNATIILADGTTNNLYAADEFGAAGIEMSGGSGTSLTIQGNTGVLNITSGSGPAIGAGYGHAGCAINIEGGIINATSTDGPGIGAAYNTACGNITISGGTVAATGGYGCPGIGGASSANCGDITITSGVTSVTATKGSEAPYSIGASSSGSCGTVTIGGVVGAITESPFTYPAAPAAAEGHALSASVVGEIVCSDGLAYAAADKDNLPTGVTAVAIVAYLGDGDTSDNTYNNGLAIAMTNANDGSSCGWGEFFASYNCVSKSNDIATAIGDKDGISSTNTLTSDGHYHEAATAAASNNGTAAPTGTSGWFLPSMGQWNLIVQGLASKKAGSAVTTDISTSGNDTYTASNLNSVITDAGGTGFNGDYHSSTQYDSESCWHMNISSGRASDYYFYAGDYVRSVLAF